VCTSMGQTLANMESRPGYFRVNRSDFKLYPCIDKQQVCKGGRFTTSTIHDQCAGNRSGLLCHKCLPGFTLVAGKNCKLCPDSNDPVAEAKVKEKVKLLIGLCSAFLMICLILILWKFLTRPPSAALTKALKDRADGVTTTDYHGKKKIEGYGQRRGHGH
jgi:hypothetical protein